MITLPTLPTAVTADNSVELSAAGDHSSASGTMPQAFLTLLGNHLLTLAQQSGSVSGETAELPAQPSANDKSLPASELSALLAALDKPEALNALLQTEKVKGQPESADDKEKLQPADLSDSDKQALQALFAMLPQTPVQPVISTVKNSDLSGATDSDNANGSKQNGLNAILSSLNSHSTTEQPATESRASLSASSAFQQALSSVSKDDTGANQSATSPLTPTLSAASAPLTPVANASVMAPATPQLNSQLGSPEWQQALSQQVVMFSRNGQQNAELHLHPQDLGSIQISLKLDNDQAQLNMVSGHSQVRAALEAAMPQLRTALAESGINLAQSNVSSDAFAQSHSFGGQQQSRSDGNNNFADARDNDNEITPIVVPAVLQARAIGSSAVDIFA
ncbi:flagellar hook-length control protein FliK [Winslowiella iniecta]|uniref:Flagellar hook-length control protein-like C-terminal domain-containing protein n=1 Tax=Winslowiella iniecta TaxID=1560201 RepID=A0A0L7SZX8_9GAMM|nr:flagellar hook-length control protein FliK [Winslowiella iniecta]KOC88749.1 hypothetical protein NG42_15135 [Winslowiella iniecta]KOC90984.1 hypothetical protein NG43_16325 [Winslowiella iniecta]